MRREDVELLQTISRRQILNPFPYKSSLAEVFHENTKITRLFAPEYARVVQSIMKQPVLTRMMRNAYKMYSLVEDTVALPVIEPGNQLEETITRRRSIRQYHDASIAANDLARLLHFSYGKTGQSPAPEHFRAVPSGGALYPLELYVIALHVDGLTPGIYHYNIDQHTLDLLRSGDFRQDVSDLIFLEGIDIEHASAVVVYSGILRRNLIKYQDRGYRMILMEAGAAAQNLTLLATSLGIGCVWVGGFLDNELNQLLGLHEVDEPTLLPIVLGKPAGRPL